MRNYLDTLLSLHPTQEEEDKYWDTAKVSFKVLFLAFFEVGVVLFSALGIAIAALCLASMAGAI